MKRTILCLVALILMLCSASAWAASSDEALITDILRQADITQPVQLSQWGDTAACFAETDGIKRLILLERHNGAWQIVIDNPTALIQGADWPELYLDSDQSIYWTYILSEQVIVRYHSYRNADGRWSPVDQFHGDSGYGEFTFIWNTSWDGLNGGEISRTFSIADENDNDRGEQLMQILPASWMTDCIWLENFDVSRFPTFFAETYDNFATENLRFFRDAAATLMPDYMFIKGILKNDAMHFLMEKPDGSRVYVICEYMSHREVRLIESSPLPKGTVLGWENFSDSLWIDGRCVTIQLLHNGTAGIEYIYDDQADSEHFLFFGDRMITSEDRDQIVYGEHPWDDIAQIDWNMLPRTRDQASLQMDASNYARVVNPNPGERLHLRERPDRKSPSLGKYYSGTPVTVLSEQGDWAEVIVGGRHGWMMKDFLDLGRQVDNALWLNTLPMPHLSSKDNEMLKVYDEPQSGAYTYHMNADQNTMKVIGIIGNDWYHVWFPATGEYGFVRQSDLTTGNG